MSDGLSWAYERREAQEAYQKHIDSGKFSKEYLENDIIRTLNHDEMRLLVTRLIIHRLGGFAKYFEQESSAKYDLFSQMSQEEQINFIKGWAVRLGLEIAPSKKLDKLRLKIKEMEELMHVRSEE